MASKGKSKKGSPKTKSEESVGGTIGQYLQSAIPEGQETVSMPDSAPSLHIPRVDNEWKDFIRSELKLATDKICCRIDTVTAELSELSKRVDGVESATDFQSKRIDDFAKQIDSTEVSMKDQINMLKKKLLEAEMYSRKSNLLVYGVPNTITTLDSHCRGIFKDKLDLDEQTVENMMFVNIHRLPRFHESDKPNPIIIKFVLMQDREAIMKATFARGKRLSEAGLSIRTDLPLELKKLRGRLLQKSAIIRKNNNLQTRVREKGTDVILYYRKDIGSDWKTLGEDQDPVLI